MDSLLRASSSFNGFVTTFLMTGVANKRFLIVFRCAALILFFLAFLLSLVTAMMYAF